MSHPQDHSGEIISYSSLAIWPFPGAAHLAISPIICQSWSDKGYRNNRVEARLHRRLAQIRESPASFADVFRWKNTGASKTSFELEVCAFHKCRASICGVLQNRFMHDVYPKHVETLFHQLLCSSLKKEYRYDN